MPSAGDLAEAPIPCTFEPKPAKCAKCAKCVKSAQLFFFRPSGGKSDAADPFLIVPMSSFEISGRHVSRCLGGNREAKSIAVACMQPRRVQIEMLRHTNDQVMSIKATTMCGAVYTCV